MKATDNRSGMTLIELMIAIVMLAIGLLAVAGSAGTVTRILTGSRMTTVAMQLGTMKMDELRAIAGSTWPRCTAGNFTSGGPVTRDYVTFTWELSGSTSRKAQVVVSYPVGPGATRTDTLVTTIACGS